MSNVLNFSNHTVIHISNKQVSCDIDGESIILNLEDGLYYGLDPIGARIWGLIEEPKTVQQIQEILLEEFEVEPQVCMHDLQVLLQDLTNRRLIEVRDELVG